MLLLSRTGGASRKGERPQWRWAAFLAGLLIATAGLPLIWDRLRGECGNLGAETVTERRADPPYLILLQRRTTDVHTTRTPYVVANMTYIETLPFDGMVVNIPASWWLMRGQPLSYSEIYDEWLAPLAGAFQQFDQNFVEVLIDDPGDVFDDEAWAVTIDNWRNLARAVRDAGFVGIFFDNEEYTGRWLNYREDYRNPARSLEEYREQTRLRGRQIMEAIVSEFPAVKLLIYHGPYISEPKTPDWVIAGQAAGGDEADLTGSLFVGFLEGLGPRAQLIDGGEVYAYRTADDFQRSYDWRKYGLPSEETDSAFIPPEVRAVWADRVSIAYGVYNLPFPAGRQMNPRIMRSTLEQALRHADDYVWFYTYRENWLIPGDMPRCWFEVVEGARAAVGLPRRAAPVASPGSAPMR